MRFTHLALPIAALSTLYGCSPPPPPAPANGHGFDSARTRLPAPVDDTLKVPTTLVPATPAQPSSVRWRLSFDAPVTTTPAVWIERWPLEDDERDRLWAVGRVDGQWRFQIYHHLYRAAPSLCAELPLDGDAGFGAVTLSADGQVGFVATDGGRIFAMRNPEACRGRAVAPEWVYLAGQAFSHTAPWIDYSSGTLYAADTGGTLHGIESAQGRSAHGFPVIASNSGFRSTPIVWGSRLWIGDDRGQLWRLDTSGDERPVIIDLCGELCGPEDAIYSSPTLDPRENQLLLTVAGRVAMVDLDCASPDCVVWSKPFDQGQAAETDRIAWSSPSINLDRDATYVTFDGRMFELPYPIDPDAEVTSHLLSGATEDSSFPRASALVLQEGTIVGDGAGHLTRFRAERAPHRMVQTAGPRLDGSINTTAIVDFTVGNRAYYGAGNQIVQMPALF